jgi:hypothetical protein
VKACRVLLLMLLSGLMSLSLNAQVNASGASSLGTWNVDTSKSGAGASAAPKGVTTLKVLKHTPKLLSWEVNFMDEKGKPVRMAWSGPMDGSMHEVQENGKPGVMRESAKLEKDGALTRHGENNDGSSFTARATLSDDGNTITDEISGKDKAGKETKETTIYRRVKGKGMAEPATKPGS